MKTVGFNVFNKKLVQSSGNFGPSVCVFDLCVWDCKNGDSIKSSDVEPYVFARLPRSSIFPHVNRT